MLIKNTAIHHTGGLGADRYAPTSHLTAENIDAAHRAEWNFKSALDRYGGYNVFIDRSGKTTQFRLIGEETAAQKGFNRDVFSVCFAGNFNINPTTGRQVDTPSVEQVLAFKRLMSALIEGKESGMKLAADTEVKLSVLRTYPHRHFNNTDCYGTALDDEWARQLIIDFMGERITLLEKVITLLIEVFSKMKKVGRFGAASVDCKDAARG